MTWPVQPFMHCFAKCLKRLANISQKTQGVGVLEAVERRSTMSPEVQ
jgi:hypothetical protein